MTHAPCRRLVSDGGYPIFFFPKREERNPLGVDARAIRLEKDMRIRSDNLMETPTHARSSFKKAV